MINMKGKLIKTENGWEVEYLEFFRVRKENGIHVDVDVDAYYFLTEYLIKTLPLHCDDVEQIEEESKVFDNIEARILSSPEIEFEIIKNQKMDGASLSAKIINNGE